MNAISNDAKTNGNKFDWELAKRMCAPDANHDEFAQFIHLCTKYKLDPFKKEIFFMKVNGRCSFIVSRDGYLKVANNHPEYDGMDSDAIYEGDKLTKHIDGRYVLEYGEAHMKFDHTKLRGSFCNVYRKDRKICSSALASYADQKKVGGTWNQYTLAMMIKCAEMKALKYAFGTEELNIADGSAEKFTNKEEQETINNLIQSKLNPQEEAQKIYAKFNITRIYKLLKKDYIEAFNMLNNSGKDIMNAEIEEIE